MNKIRQQFGHLDCLYIDDGSFFEPNSSLLREGEEEPLVSRVLLQPLVTKPELLLKVSAGARVNCFVAMVNISSKEDFEWYQNAMNSIQSEQKMAAFFIQNKALLDTLPVCDYQAFDTFFAKQYSTELRK